MDETYEQTRSAMINSINPKWNHVVHKAVFEAVYDAAYKQANADHNLIETLLDNLFAIRTKIFNQEPDLRDLNRLVASYVDVITDLQPGFEAKYGR